MLAPSSILNSKYYYFPDGPYKPLNRDAFETCQSYNWTEIKVVVTGFPKRNPKIGECVQIPVKIINKGSSIFYSHANSGYKLGYQWRKDGAIVEVPVLHTIVEVDVADEYAQFMRVQMPFEAGRFTLITGITDDNDRLYGADSAGLRVEVTN